MNAFLSVCLLYCTIFIGVHLSSHFSDRRRLPPHLRLRSLSGEINDRRAERVAAFRLRWQPIFVFAEEAARRRSISDEKLLDGDDEGGGSGRVRHARDRSFWSHLLPVSAFGGDDSRVSTSSFKISLFLLIVVAVGVVISVFLLFNRLNAPYLCQKDGIVLHCPHVKESPSLWENPYSATASWKPYAERRTHGVSDLPPENETNGYIFIHAEGGLNQQRIAICNAVAVAKIMNATLILPVLKQDQIWKESASILMKFEDIFDVDHFIDYLKDDIRIVRDIPEWFIDRSELFTSIRSSSPFFYG